MIEKKISLLKNKLSRVEKGLEAARQTGNEQLMALNIRQGFNAWLLDGLYRLKDGQDAAESFEKAISLTREHIQLVESENVSLPFDRLNIIGYYVGKEKIVRESGLSFGLDSRLDFLLGEALYGIDVSKEWEDAIQQLSQEKDKGLFVATYENYWKLLKSESVGLDNLLSEAEELYYQRKNDPYYRGGDQTEGGGEDNQYVVDYRLLSILKFVNGN